MRFERYTWYGRRVRESWLFRQPSKQHGRPCTMVGGRPWSALRTPERTYSCCRGPQDPHEARSCALPVGGDVVDPRCLCSSRQRSFSTQDDGWCPVRQWCRTARPVENRLARPTRSPPSPRWARQTRWRGVVHIQPPLLRKSPRDLDDSRAVCPISRTSMHQGPQPSSYAD